MTTTVRLDTNLEEKLYLLTKSLGKKKSDVIREAIEFYATSIENSKKSRILQAIEKTKDADKELNSEFEGVVSDAL
jgi:predicted DNA-binding protein